MVLKLETVSFSIVCIVISKHRPSTYPPNFQFPAMRHKKTPIARKRRIAKTSVSLCVLFDYDFLFLTQILSPYLIGWGNDQRWCELLSPFDSLFPPSCSNYVLALEEIASGPTSNWLHPSCKYQLYFKLFWKVSYHSWSGHLWFMSLLLAFGWVFFLFEFVFVNSWLISFF